MPTLDPGAHTPLRDHTTGDAHALEVRAALNRFLRRDLTPREREALKTLQARMAARRAGTEVTP